MAASASSTSSHSVIMYDEEYSILSAPSKSSAIVKVQENDLIGSLDLEALVQDLAQVGGFIKIAYNATAAAPSCEEIHKLQQDIVRLGYDITDLCNKSAITVSDFSSTTRIILEELQVAYDFLLGGFEDMAIDSIACLSDLAGKMAQAALELKEEFDKQAKVVQSTVKKFGAAKKKSEKDNQAAKRSQEKFKSLIALEEQKIQEAADLEEKSRKEREEYESKADDEIGKIRGPNFFEVALNAFTTIAITTATITATTAIGAVVGGVPAAVPPTLAISDGPGTQHLHDSNEAAKMKADEFKETAQRKLELEMEQQKLRQERKQKHAEFMNDLQSTKITEIDTEKANEFLHHALDGLRGLSVVMLKAACFWTMLKKHCQRLAEDSIKKMIKNGMKKESQKERLEFWTSTAFKRKAISYTAKWVALNSMCEKHMKMIRITQRDLYDYIRDNPTREEAQQSLPGLIEKYKAGLKKEQEKSKEVCAGLQKMIKESSNSSAVE